MSRVHNALTPGQWVAKFSATVQAMLDGRREPSSQSWTGICARPELCVAASRMLASSSRLWSR